MWKTARVFCGMCAVAGFGLMATYGVMVGLSRGEPTWALIVGILLVCVAFATRLRQVADRLLYVDNWNRRLVVELALSLPDREDWIGSFWLFYSLAEQCEKLGYLADAETFYQKALSANRPGIVSEQIVCLRALAQLLDRTGRRAEARLFHARAEEEEKGVGGTERGGRKGDILNYGGALRRLARFLWPPRG